MADMSGDIGRLRLGQVILPATHDSATYGFLSGPQDGPDPPGYTVNQNTTVKQQLDLGVRVLDLRGRKFTWSGTEDYYVYHGKDTTSLKLATVLDDVASWTLTPGHEKEVLIVKVATDKVGPGAPARLNDICGNFKQKVSGLLLTPDVFPEAASRLAEAQRAQAMAIANPLAPPLPVPEVPDISRYTLDEVWRLPNHQRIILDWGGCGYAWPDNTFNTYWANQCYAKDYTGVAAAAAAVNEVFTGVRADPAAASRPGIIEAVRIALVGRLRAKGADGRFNGLGSIETQPTAFKRELGRNAPVGFYSVGAHASITPECAFPLDWFVGTEQGMTLDALKSWFDNGENHARDYLNIISVDYVQDSKLMDYVLQMNKPKD